MSRKLGAINPRPVISTTLGGRGRLRNYGDGDDEEDKRWKR
jgi:hypothetical protein